MSFIFYKNNRYESVDFSSEEELEELIFQHKDEIFWSWLDIGKYIYIDKKVLISSKAGLKTIPDGYLLWLGESKEDSKIYFVETELASHSNTNHIMPQIINFKRTLNNYQSRNIIVDTLYREIANHISIPKIQKQFGSRDIHKIINDLIDKGLGVIILIDKFTDELKEVYRDVQKLVEEYYVLEINAFVKAGVRLKLKPRTKVWALYPDFTDIEIPEWYSAIIKKQVKNGYLVDWNDGDKTNRTVGEVIPFNDYIIRVNLAYKEV